MGFMERTVQKPAKERHENQTMTLPPLVDVETLAWMLGHVSKAHVWNMHQDGRLGPMSIKLGTRTFWRRDEINAWIAAGCPQRDRWVQMPQAKEWAVSCCRN